jgi:death-on-curing family protein
MLGARYIEHIHDDLVAQLWPGTALPGPGGLRDAGLLESAVARPFQSAFGEDAYPTVFEKAVALFHSLNANHPFQDGNKRTAVIALSHFLLANDYWLVISNAGVYEIAKRTASYRERGLSHDDSLQEIANFLRPMVIPLSGLKTIWHKGRAQDDFYKLLTQLKHRIRRDKNNRLFSSS